MKNKKMTKISYLLFLFTFIMMLFLPYPQNAKAISNTIYVDIDNVGPEDGLTWATAWNSIQEGVDDPNFTGSTGNIVLVAEGIYTEEVTLTSAQAGANGSYNTIKANPGDTVIVDAEDTRQMGFNVGFAGGGVDYLEINGFDVRNAIWFGNILVYNSDYVRIINNIIHDNSGGYTGLYNYRSDNSFIDSNTVYNMSSVAPGNYGYGLYVQQSMNGVVTNNTVYDSHGGIEFECNNTSYPTDNGLAENNLLHDNDWGINNNNVKNTTIRNNTIYNMLNYGIILDNYWDLPARLAQDNLIEKNTIYNVYGDTYGFAIYILANYGGASATSDNIVRNNLIYSSETGVRLGWAGGTSHISNNTIINNTINNSDEYGINGTNNSDNNIFRNNIITNGENGANFESNSLPSEFNYNNVWDNTTDYSGIMAGANDLSVSPFFVSESDFHLQSQAGSYHNGAWTADSNNSPLIDAGDPGDEYSSEPNYNGGRINVGAYGNTIEASKTIPPIDLETLPPVGVNGVLLIILISLIMAVQINKIKLFLK